MNVFISWSGPTSRKLAEVLKNWLPSVLQAVKPYFSPDDIEKGTRWASEIAKVLEQASVGVICITSSNLSAPWLMFEAGALAKSVERSRVIPLLFGVEPADLSGPLLQFQAVTFNKEDVGKMLRTVNAAAGPQGLDASVLEAVFQKWWPDLEASVARAMRQDTTEQQEDRRSDRHLLEEILELSRARVYGTGTSNQIDPDLLRPIDDLKLSTRTGNSLKTESIFYIGDLVLFDRKELLRLPFMTASGLREIEEALESRGFALGMILEGWDSLRPRE